MYNERVNEISERIAYANTYFTKNMDIERLKCLSDQSSLALFCVT